MNNNIKALTISVLATVLTHYVAHMGILEASIVFSSYYGAILLAFKKRMNFIWTGVGAFLSVILFTYMGLYASVIINLMFLISSTIGYTLWGATDDKRAPRVSNKKFYLLIPLIVLTGWAGMFYLTSSLGGIKPAVNSLMFALSLVAQILIIRGDSLNWVFNISVASLGVWVFYSTGMIGLMIQFVFFALNGIYGMISWNTDKENKRKSEQCPT